MAKAEVMSPAAWRGLEKINKQNAAALLGVRKGTYTKYEAGRVPQPAVVGRFFFLSGGRVEPNDLYCLPELATLAAARHRIVDAALAIHAAGAGLTDGLVQELDCAVAQFRTANEIVTSAGLALRLEVAEALERSA